MNCPFCDINQDSTVESDYKSLLWALSIAYEQATCGKGKERHATDKPFHNQPINVIRGLVGGGYTLGQAIKKAQESQRMESQAAIKELAGAINYLASEMINRNKELRDITTLDMLTE